MQVPRSGKGLQNEYFTYQLFSALGLPAPKTDLVKIFHEGDDSRIYINSVLVYGLKENVVINKEQVCQIESAQYRIHPSMLTSFFAEMVVLDRDNL